MCTKHTIHKYAISGRYMLLHLFFDEQNMCISRKKRKNHDTHTLLQNKKENLNSIVWICFFILGNIRGKKPFIYLSDTDGHANFKITL